MPDPAPAAAPTPGALRTRYAEAFRGWLAHRDERELGTAYDLGREAVRAQMSVLDLAEAHHDAARAALRDESDPERRSELVGAASVFFGEALSTFEIAHRGYHEVQEVARLEHEHVMQLRALAEEHARRADQLATALRVALVTQHRARGIVMRRGQVEHAELRADRLAPEVVRRAELPFVAMGEPGAERLGVAGAQGARRGRCGRRGFRHRPRSLTARVAPSV